MVELIGRLLSELHRAYSPDVCPGDWAWTITVAGALFGLLPMAGVMAVAAIRHLTGNRYDAGSLVAFAGIGFLLVGALPLWAFSATSEVFRGAAQGAAVGLADESGTLGQPFCLDGVQQVAYLGGSASVRAAVGDLSGSGVRTVLAALLAVTAPFMALLFVYIQARIAFRRGPAWPARLLWLPVLLLVVGTLPLSVTVTAHLWLGFVTACMAGIVGVMLVGPPRRSVLDAGAGRQRSPAAGYAPRPAASYPGQRPGQPIQPGSPGQPGLPMPTRAGWPPQTPAQPWAGPSRPMPPTLVSPEAEAGSAGPTAPAGLPAPGLAVSGLATPAAAAGKLAADPGPLPATLQQALAAAETTRVDSPRSGPDGEQTAMLPSSRFQRIKPLGAGGFGQVWLAMDTKLGRTVAVKVATAHNTETQQRIQREARALAAVHHPNCVRIYDIVDDLDGGGLAIVMEYVPGQPLGDVVSKGLYSDAEAAKLWFTLAGALDAAHGKGLLHRDVKPSNIIITDDGTPRLIDFGIARATGDVTLTAAGLVVGTPDFLPPEIASGQPPARASDAWQLAAAVSFALTGSPPRGHSDGAVAAMLAAARGEPCNQLPANSAHRVLLQRSLHTDPAARPTLPAVQAELAGWIR